MGKYARGSRPAQAGSDGPERASRVRRVRPTGATAASGAEREWSRAHEPAGTNNRASAPRVPGAPVRRWLRPADRLHQPLEPSFGASDLTAQGDRDSSRAWG